MINSCLQIYTLVKTNVLMNKVDQASEIREHITLKRRLVDAIYVQPRDSTRWCKNTTYRARAQELPMS